MDNNKKLTDVPTHNLSSQTPTMTGFGISSTGVAWFWLAIYLGFTILNAIILYFVLLNNLPDHWNIFAKGAIYLIGSAFGGMISTLAYFRYQNPKH